MTRSLRLALALAVCIGGEHALAQIQPNQPLQSIQPSGPMGDWRAPDGRSADTRDSAECRGRAGQGAHAYKPADDPGQRYEQEARLYDRCMRAKGFTR